MKFNYPVPSHFQFSGRDGSGTWKKVRDGSGTGIPSDPAYKYKEKQKEQILFSAKRWIGHFVSRSYRELVSFRAPSTLPLANIMSPALSVNFEKHCSQQSPPDFKLYLGELFFEHLNLLHTYQHGTRTNSFIYLFEKRVLHKNWQKRIF